MIFKKVKLLRKIHSSVNMPYAFVQIHTMYTTNNELPGKVWTMAVLSINSNICSTLAKDNKNQGSYRCGRTMAYTASLYFLFNVAMKLKIL